MKQKHRFKFILMLLGIFFSGAIVYAATSPNLAIAKTFAILSSTYSNTSSGTTIKGDLGYTTNPATSPTVNGNTHKADSTYNQAGIDQNSALSSLNSKPCTFSFAPGAIDLASDVTHGTVGVYVPGVYCITGAASINGGGTINFKGSGTYIFRMTGAFTTSANSIVTITNGASSCDVWWTPISATTLGANSTFNGTDIDAAGITIGNNVGWTGRALAFGGTVSTSADNITAPTCASTTSKTTTNTANQLVDTGNFPIWNIVVGIVLLASVLFININRLNNKKIK
jgi:hypothetical protein